MKIYSANEVIEKVEGLNSISTLNKWVNFIQKEFHHEFPIIYIPFESYQNHQRGINHKKARGYSEEDIKKLQQVAYFIKELGRDEALRQVFDSHYQLEKLSHHELLEVMIQKLDSMNNQFKNEIVELKAKNQNLLLKFHELESIVVDLKEISNQSSGRLWRKR